jgi:hypothetical protein
MAIDEIVTMLIAERDRLNRAIEALQGPVRRRGRPPANPLTTTPGWVQPAVNKAPRKKGARKFTQEQREAQAARMKLYWSKKKKAAKK